MRMLLPPLRERRAIDKALSRFFLTHKIADFRQAITRLCAFINSSLHTLSGMPILIGEKLPGEHTRMAVSTSCTRNTGSGDGSIILNDNGLTWSTTRWAITCSGWMLNEKQMLLPRAWSVVSILSDRGVLCQMTKEAIKAEILTGGWRN
jgi:hypothetical protein